MDVTGKHGIRKIPVQPSIFFSGDVLLWGKIIDAMLHIYKNIMKK